MGLLLKSSILIKNQQSFSKRISLSFYIIFFIFIILIGRLFFLQIINKHKYTLLSDKNRIYTVYSAAPRGTIYDRKGKILASSRTEYQAALNLNQYQNHPQKWVTLCRKLNLDPSIALSSYIKKQIKSNGPSSIIPLKDHLNWHEILSLENLSLHIPGLVVIPKSIRTYPYGQNFCHCIGYVTPPQQEDIERNANLKVLNATLGKTGIEQTADKFLQGTIGLKQLEVNANRHVIRILEESKPIPGKSISLTLDADLQQQVVQIMKNIRCGVALVMEIPTGDILACLSLPTFDPHMFVEPMTAQQWKDISHHQDSPLLNRSIAGLYAPGSTFKMVVALTALEAHIITPETYFFCPGYYKINNSKFHCWRWRVGGHGSLNIIQALEQSCDIFFYNVAAKLGSTAILKTAQDFGFGEKTYIELNGEKKGSLPRLSRTWLKQDFGQAINLSIGQGHLTATPLQLITMTARLASGLNIQPHIIQHQNTNLPQPLSYSPASLKIIQKGMEKAVWGTQGTARNAQSNTISIAGKTGSTQVCRIKIEERQKGKLIKRPYHLKDHALFIGYAPFNKPRFAVVVIVEHGESGGRVAAPLGQEILIATEKIFSPPIKNNS